MKRRQQVRELYKTIDEKDLEEKEENTEFEGKHINYNWSTAFNIKTPSISRTQPKSPNTSILVRMLLLILTLRNKVLSLKPWMTRIKIE